MKIVDKFKSNPSRDYSMSVAATWAGAGSLIIGMQMVQNYGVVPFMLWALGNVLACIVFGLMAGRYEYLRKVFTSSGMKLVLAFICIFQIWVNMSGLHDSLLVISPSIALVATYVMGAIFVLFYLKFAMIRNILTDSGLWKLVYILIIALVAISLIAYGINVPSLGIEEEGMMQGLTKCITLIPGAFFYPCFWAMFLYNEQNSDGVKEVDMQKSFVKGGLYFAVYLAFVFLLGITDFSPELEVIKGILIAIIALTSLTSFIYSMYVSIGRKFGFALNVFSLVGWYWLIPMGVMGVWTLMADIRFGILILAIIVAFVWKKYDDDKKQKVAV